MTKNRVCAINCYWGPWPKWIGIFMETCSTNSDIDWLFFTDNSVKPLEARNINYIEFPLGEFNKLASRKLNIRIQLENSYKVCDLKPAFGKIFEDYLHGHEFWGYFDIDLLFGNISHFVNKKTLANFDIISFYSHFLSGPFCLFRNQKHINQLYRNISDYKRILQNPEHFGLDENIRRQEIEGFSIKKLGLGFIFLFRKLMKKAAKLFDLSIDELLYEFQWFYKRYTLKPNHLVDMTEVIWNYSALGKVNALFANFLESDRSYKRNNRKEWKITWEKGFLNDEIIGKELLGFHFVENKKTLSIDSPEKLSQISIITITEKKIKVE